MKLMLPIGTHSGSVILSEPKDPFSFEKGKRIPPGAFGLVGMTQCVSGGLALESMADDSATHSTAKISLCE